MELMTIDRKGLKVGIKNGFGFSDFEEKYGLDKQGLSDAVMVLYKRNKDTAEDLLREITKNEKKREKEREKEPVKEYKGVPIEEFMNMSMDDFMEIEKGATQGEEPKISREVILEDEIRQLEDEVIKNEKQYNNWLGQHRDSTKQMGKLEERLTNLRDELVKLKEKYNCIAERRQKITEKANYFLGERQKAEAVLEEKRQERERLSRIAVGVYADGTVALMEPDTTDVSLNDEGWEAHFTNLSDPHRTECQELRMREVTAISKMLAIIENDGGAHGFEIAFDNSEMEAAYDTINPTPTK
ncbi:hypothetical protein IJJ02_01840 [Candidatus Saccharibacteria bacterium]|nr:hypothetical protein [Candidatus Saccharibacteria bacterium]